MKNLPVVFFIPSIGMKILILVLFNNILVFFDRGISIPCARARIHKVFYPCNRCHLATLSENQCVMCGNEVTRVTTNGVFALNIHSTLRYRDREFFIISPCLCISVFTKIQHVGCEDIPIQHSTPWNKQEGAAFKGRRCRLRGSKVPPPWVEGAAFKGRRYGLHRRNKKLYKLIWCIPQIMLSLQKEFFYRLNNYYYEEKIYLRCLWIYL